MFHVLTMARYCIILDHIASFLCACTYCGVCIKQKCVSTLVYVCQLEK